MNIIIKNGSFYDCNQTQAKFCLCFTKTNIKRFHFGALKLPLIPKVSPSPNTNNHFINHYQH